MIRPLITFSPGTLGIVSRAPCPPPARGPGGRRRRRLRWRRVAYFNGIDFSEHWERVSYLDRRVTRIQLRVRDVPGFRVK